MSRGVELHLHPIPRARDSRSPRSAERRSAPAAASVSNETDDGAATGAPAPPLLASFPALSPNAVVPADPILAAGPDHVLVAVNSSFAIYTKSGANLFQTTAGLWFLPAASRPGRGRLCCPRPAGRLRPVPRAVDPPLRGHGRRLAVLDPAFGLDELGPDRAVALVGAPGDRNGSAASGNFSDFPALGFDDAAIYIATNQYAYSSRRRSPTRRSACSARTSSTRARARSRGPTSGISKTRCFRARRRAR